ncbi:hypothetical protein BgiBS90_030562 [Biomphalaria glabrata]|nr:hypothetical protein BgiBS90_030562 [Biomphalaria glabrata]
MPHKRRAINDQTDQADSSSLGNENQDTGDHETRESEGGKADLHKYLVGCNKNPGHSQFIPVDTFTLKHLPKYLQDKDLYEYIKDSPSNVWWEFDVSTATHVVFDDIEDNHRTLRLFYNSNENPVVNVDKVRVDYVSIEYDMCRLRCVTCDKNVGNKLLEMFKHMFYVWEKMWNKYNISRSKHKFSFIVSHPHGCSKQVSVGQWKDRYKIGERRYKFTYTTCTCPGSSGANVHCLRYNDYWMWPDPVHSGSFKSGLNYSGVVSLVSCQTP